MNLFSDQQRSKIRNRSEGAIGNLGAKSVHWLLLLSSDDNNVWLIYLNIQNRKNTGFL